MRSPSVLGQASCRHAPPNPPSSRHPAPARQIIYAIVIQPVRIRSKKYPLARRDRRTPLSIILRPGETPLFP